MKELLLTNYLPSIISFWAAHVKRTEHLSRAFKKEGALLLCNYSGEIISYRRAGGLLPLYDEPFLCG